MHLRRPGILHGRSEMGLNTFLIGGEHGVVKYQNLRIWAERGLIRIEDARDNSYETLTVREAILRVKGFNDMIGNSAEDRRNPAFWDMREKLQRLVEEMSEVIRKAQMQGMPDDPTYHPQRPAAVVVPQLAYDF